MLTPQQKEAILAAKAKGLTKEQAYARAFATSSAPTTPQSGVSETLGDVKNAFVGVGEDLNQRGTNIIEGYKSQFRGEQTPIETGVQIAGNVLGGAGDIAGRAIIGGVSLFTNQGTEDAIKKDVETTIQSTGLPEQIDKLSPRTKRNLTGGMGLLEGITTGLGSSITKPLGKLFKGAEKVDAVPTVRTADDVFKQAEEGLKRQANDPNLDARAQEEAARASLSFQERYIGLEPDVKKRLGDMGPEKLQEYLDAVHKRNIDDTAPTPYEIGSQNVNDAVEKLQTQLNDTGRGIGQTREKLATVRAPITSVERIESVFSKEIDSLGLTIKNGEIVVKPGTISKASAASDLKVIQSLYNDLKIFKQSPTLKNAIDLRMAFDGKIKFGKSAREVSNSVDPLSRSVRSAIASEAAKVVGKTNAADLQTYSDFMEAFGDLKSYTDRAAGGEYLLRLVLSGRGGDSRRLIETIKNYTGVDLMNDATAMKVATDTLGNQNTQNLFRQEIERAGYDVSAILTGGPVGIVSVIGKKLFDYGIDAEEVLKKAALGGGGAYAVSLMAENKDAAPMIGLLVGSAVPTVRKEIVQALAKNIDDNTADEMFNFNRVIKEKAVTTNKDGTLEYKEIDGMTPKQVRNAYEDGLRILEIDSKGIENLASKTPAEIAKFFDDVLAIIDGEKPLKP